MRKIIILFLIVIQLNKGWAQQAVITAGENLVGAGGSVSYTIGQIDYFNSASATGSENRGVQQSYQPGCISVSKTIISICASSLPYTWNGLTFNGAGTQTVHLITNSGCDSAATLILSLSSIPNAFNYAGANSFAVGTAITPLYPVANMAITPLGSGFSNPFGVAVDASGNVYLADQGNKLVKKVATNGTIATLGSGFNQPLGMAVDGAGNVYVSDYGNSAVKKIDSNGTVTTMGSGFNNPYGVAVDVAGNVYVADTYNNAVKKIAVNGSAATLGAGFSNPFGVAVDASGNVYVADYGNNAVKKIASNGTITTLGSGFGASGIAVDAVGNVYMSDISNGVVKKLAPDGTITTLASGLTPTGIAVDAAGNVYVADYGSNAIKKIPGAGGVADSYTISPALPAGLSLNSATGVVSGTPAYGSSAAVYTVTASNCAGSTNGSLSIAVACANTSSSTTISNYGSYTWNGTLYNTSGIYTKMLTNVAGCDSIATLNLTITTTTITWTGNAGTDWSNAANWNTNTVPGATDNVTVANVTNAPVINSSQSIGSMIINNGASLAVTGTLQIAGNISNGGTFTATSGTVIFNGTSAQTIPANTFSTNTVQNLTINNNAGVILGGILNVTGVLTPTAGTLTTGGFLTLKSSALATASVAAGTGTYIIGNATVERFIPSLNRRAYTMLTAPVNGSTIYNGWQEAGANTNAGYGIQITGGTGTSSANGFDATSYSGFASIFTYNDALPTGSKWVQLSNTNVNTLAPGKGYYVYIRGDRAEARYTTGVSGNSVLRATGTLSTGNVSPALTTALATHFNLVANPYASAVNWTTGITKTNIDDAFWVFDPNLGTTGTFVTYSNGIVSPADARVTQYLQSGQAFFVRNSATGTPSLTFTEASKTTAAQTASVNTVFGIETPASRLNINVYKTTDNTLADGVVAIFANTYKAGLGKEDAAKMDNFNETFSLKRNDSLLSIEGRPQITGNDTLFFSMKNFAKQAYTLKTEVINFNAANAVLVDNYTGSRTALDPSVINNYPFTVNGDEASGTGNRFMIVLGSMASTIPADAAAANELFVRVSPNPVKNQVQVSFKTAVTNKTVINIINSLGQVVRKVDAGKVNSGSVSINTSSLAGGVYMVQLVSGGKIIATEKVVKE